MVKKQRYNLQQGLQELRAFIKGCAEGLKPAGSIHPSRMFFREGLGGLNLDREESIKYERILETLSPDEGSPRTISRASVEALIQECVLTSLDFSNKQAGLSLDQRIDASLKILRTKLESPLVDWEVWLPVARMKVSGAGFAFGKAFFCDKDHDLARQAQSKVRSIIKSGLKPGEEAGIAEFWPEEFSQFALCRIVVKAGDTTAAQELATVELETTASVLNFFASVVFPVDFLPLVCLPGELLSYEMWTLVLGDQPNPLCHSGASIERLKAALDLKKFQEHEPIAKSMDKASAMLRDEGETGYRERLLTAMKWAGKGATAVRREDAFLFYSIALEALLLGGSHDEQLSYRVRLRAAHLLGLNQAGRTRVRDLVNDLYGMRSKIVHTGKTQIPKADLSRLRIITQSAIIHLLSDDQFAGVATDKALEAWFEESLMRGPELTSPPRTL